MDEMIAIIELIDNQYILNKQTLKRILSLSHDCNEISIISLVGIECQGKSLLIKCFDNYLKSNEKKKWTESNDSVIEINAENRCVDTITVEMSSKPYILTEEHRRIAVYLMDTNGVLDNDMTSQLTDILSLFLLTSSTVIYSHKSFIPLKCFVQLENSINRITESENREHILKKILIAVEEWNPGNHDQNIGFGLRKTQLYLNSILKTNQLSQDFNEIEIFLMSKPEIDPNCDSIYLSKSSGQFKRNLLCLIFNLLNIDSIQVMVNNDNNEFLKPEDIVSLFIEYTNKLNTNQDIIESLNQEMRTLSIDDRIDSENVEQNEIQIKLVEEAKKAINEILDTNDPIFTKPSALKHNYSENANNYQSIPVSGKDNFDRKSNSETENIVSDKTQYSSFKAYNQLNLVNIDSESKHKETQLLSAPENVSQNETEMNSVLFSKDGLNECKEENKTIDISFDTKHSNSENIDNYSSIKVLKSLNFDEMLISKSETWNFNSEKAKLLSSKACKQSDLNNYDNEGKQQKIQPLELISTLNEPQTNPIIRNKITSISYESIKHNENDMISDDDSSISILNEEDETIEYVSRSTDDEEYSHIGSEEVNQFQESHSPVQDISHESVDSCGPINNDEDINSDANQNIDNNSDNSWDQMIFEPNMENLKPIINCSNNNNKNREKRDEFDYNKELKQLVDDLLEEYESLMENRIKEQNFDLNNDLNYAHNYIEKQLIEKYERFCNNISNNCESSLYCITQYRSSFTGCLQSNLEKYENIMNSKKNEVRDEYRKAVKKVSKLYDIEMKSKIKENLRTHSNGGHLNTIQNWCQTKCERVFREETQKFYKGLIRSEFDQQLKQNYSKMNTKFQNFYTFFEILESDLREILKKDIYLSENEIKNINDIQRREILELLDHLNDLELKDIAFSLLESKIDILRHNIRLNIKHEEELHSKAITLALSLYFDCLESKLKSKLYFDKNGIQAIRTQLFQNTLIALKFALNIGKDIKYVNNKLENDLRNSIDQNYNAFIDKHKESFEKAMSNSSKVKEDSEKKYCMEMSSRLSVKSYHKTNEYNKIHIQCSEIAFKYFEERIVVLEKSFDERSAQKLIVGIRSELRRMITNRKEYFKQMNDKNAPKSSPIGIHLGFYSTAVATYLNKVEPLLDQNNKTFRKNSIAFSDEILLGQEAYEYLIENYNKTYADFDIKKLLGKKQFSEEDLKGCQLSLTRNDHLFRLKYSNIDFNLRIESLLALMLNKFKTEAENKFSNNFSTTVITVPNNYLYNKKNAIRDSSKIAEFENIHIISEMNALALGFRFGKQDVFQNDESVTVLLIILDNYECDVAVCQMTEDKIDFKYKLHHNLAKDWSSGYKLNPFQYIPFFNKYSNVYINNFDKLFSKLMEKSMIKIHNIDEYVIVGKSFLMNEFKQYFKNKKEYICDPLMTILKGTTYYSALLNGNLRQIEINDKFVFPISIKIFRNGRSSTKDSSVLKLRSIPFSHDFQITVIAKYDLPIELCIYEGEYLAIHYLIESLPKDPNKSDPWAYLGFNVCACDSNIFTVKAFVRNYSNTAQQTIDLIARDMSLSDEDLDAEQQKIKLLFKKKEEKKSETQMKSTTDIKKKELIEIWTKKRNSIENVTDIRPLIKRKILKEIDESLAFFKTKDLLDLNFILKENEKLENAIKLLTNI